MNKVTKIVLSKLFAYRQGFKSKLSVTFCEVYNNEVRDLLRNPKLDDQIKWENNNKTT